MKSATDDTSPPKEPELDGLLAGWPELASPEGGFDALAERVKARVSDAAATVDESVDAFERPVLDGGAAEEAAPKSNGAAIDTLAALARESAAPKRDSKKPAEAEDKSSSSGVINFKALIEQGAAEDAAGAKALAEAARPAEAVDLSKTTPATPVSIATAAPAATAQPAPERRSNAATWALVAVIGVACIVAYTTFGARGSAPAPEGRNTDEETSPADEQGGSAASDERAEQEGRGARREANEAPTAAPATVTPSTPAEDREGAAPGTTEHAAGPTKRPSARAAGGGGREASESPGPAAPAAAPAAPSGQAVTATSAPPQAATKRATADLDDLISGSLGGSSGPAPGQPAAATKAAAPPEGALPQPNRQQIQRGMGRVAGAVRACANGQSGMAMMRVTFVSDGSVSNVAMAGGPFAGTPSAACMENAVRSARVPPFTNASVTISYPFVIQPPDPAAAPVP